MNGGLKGLLLMVMGGCLMATVAHAELESRIDISGSFRARYESLDGQFRAGGSGGDQVLNLRTLVKVDVDLGNWGLVAEGMDSRQELGDEASSLGTGIVDALDLLQLKADWAGEDWALSLGRMTLDMGSRRLLARNKFRNTVSSFTGLDWSMTRGDGSVWRAFATVPVNRLPGDKASLLDNDIQLDEELWDTLFAGIYWGKQQLIGEGNAEVFLLWLNEEDSEGYTSKDRELLTLDGRWYKKASKGQFDYEVELALQTGEARSSKSAANTRDLDVLAWFIHGELGYSFDSEWKPRLVAQFDYASGDNDPGDGNWEQFDSLYGARRFDFGPTGIYGPFARGNLVTPGLRMVLTPGKGRQLMLAARAYWLAEDSDSWIKAKVKDALGNSGNYLGEQVELRYRHKLSDSIKLECGAAWYHASGFAVDAPNASGTKDSVYWYVQSGFGF